MKMKRIISTVLAVLMLVSAFAVTTSAEDATQTTDTQTWKTKSSQPTIDYFTGRTVKKVGEEYVVDTESEVVIKKAEDKLEYMDLRFEKDGYQLYVDHYSGEVATRCIETGEILFSNPYTVGDSGATESIKTQLLSQLVIKYVDISTGDDETYYSYEWAAQRNQILVRNIKNGIRVEYTIGREEARMLVPRLIEKSSFETKIKNVMEKAVEGNAQATFLFNKLMAYYLEYNPDTQSSQALIDEMYKQYPITKKMAVYALDNSAAPNELATLEQLIKTYCPDYTYEELDEDHMLTEYEGDDKNPPLFKMALEYTLDDMGVTVRLPANGIRFNESLYQLYSIEILPYMGAGAKSNTEGNFSQYNSGYTFFPDGSGALFDFEKITDLGSSATITGKVYGQDYAYHTISGTHQEVIRYPVFGVTETQDMTALEHLAISQKTSGNSSVDCVISECDVPAEEREYKKTGFVAVVEEGDALMELSSYHAVRTSEFNTVRMIVYPRPQDTYNVADSISVGANDTWTVVSSRKYTGDYSIRYIMLTDDGVAQSKGITDYYDCNYVGMARAYREYLEKKDVLTRIDEEEVGEDIPLYIEAFGALQTTERILSIPVDVMTPLTTFEDVQTMRDKLAENGITNINFILKGFTKGGLTDRQAPYYVDWDGAVDGELSFEELLANADRDNYSIYPDFDFAYVMGDGLFDGVSLKNHAVKTIDNRYTSKREYSATKQTYVSYFELAISPAYYVHYYEKFTEEYNEYGADSISISTLGSALNSDFDEDEPYNREDSKGYTIEALAHFAENYENVMTSGGNAYSWGYVDYITDIALDSSRFSQAYASVPFLGMVLHGYVEIAGTPINMEGNIEYAVLKAIENGASLKFILSYRNTNNLKNFEDLSKYYSVRYDIWFEDVVALYSEVNDVLSGVQTSLIEKHEFVNGFRVPDADELLADAANTIEKALANEEAYLDADTQAEKDEYRNARFEIKNFYEIMNGEFKTMKEKYEIYLNSIMDIDMTIDNYLMLLEAEQQKIAEADAIINATDSSASAKEDAQKKKTAAEDQIALIKNQISSALNDVLGIYKEFVVHADEYDDAVKNNYVTYTMLDEYRELVKNDPNLTQAQKDDILALVAGNIGSDIVSADVVNAEKIVLQNKYNNDVAAYNSAIDSNTVLSDELKAEYKDLEDIAALIELINANADIDEEQKTTLVDLLEAISATDKLLKDSDDADIYLNIINKQLVEAKELLLANINKVQADAEDTSGTKPFVADTFIAPEDATCTLKPEEEQEENAKAENVVAPVYPSDENKIVYEVYDNGTTFLLNFNNYQVMVEIDGVIYTLDAYGYIVLSNND